MLWLAGVEYSAFIKVSSWQIISAQFKETHKKWHLINLQSFGKQASYLIT